MLKGLKVLQFQGLAPSVFCGMYFADQGADVILVARPEPAPFSMEIHKNIMNRSKKCIKLSLKNQKDKQIVIQIIKNVDVIIDPYRPGILQKENIGPEDLKKINPNVILLRVTGYGQFGDTSLKPGHDLNYISTSGVLKLINNDKQNLQFPTNYLADFVSASLGIAKTLIELKNKKQKGCVIDCSLAGGCSYLTNVVLNDQSLNQITKSQKLQYFDMKQKRFLITQYKNCGNISIQTLTFIVTQMIEKNQSFIKNDQFQIAQIKKIKKIKESVLSNPFAIDLLQFSKQKKLIPKRDENREEILAKFVKMTPKL